MTAPIAPTAQRLPLLSTSTPDSSPRGDRPPDTGPLLTKDNKPLPGDKISLSNQSRQAVRDAQREEANNANNSDKLDRAISKVQFVYNTNGNLSIRYMDTANRVIYQTPSELLLRLDEGAASVDTSA